MKRRPIIAYLVAVLFLLGLSLPRSAEAASVPVALLPFTSEDDSWLSQKAAADFSAALQALLSEEPGVVWIERAQLKQAVQELSLAKGGFLSPSRSLEAGRWAKAELAILGRFGRQVDGKHTLTVEVVDLIHGELLSKATGLFAPAENPSRFTYDGKQSLSPMLGQLEVGRGLLQTNLQLAVSTHRNRTNQLSVAVLHWLGDTAANQTLVQHLRRSDSGDIRLAEFSRLGRALDENSLTLLGLVDQSSEPWKRFASRYTWLETTEKFTGFARASEAPPGTSLSDRKNIELEIYQILWTGSGSTETNSLFKGTIMARDRNQQITNVMRMAVTNIIRAQSPTKDEAAKVAVSKRLFEAAMQMPETYGGIVSNYDPKQRDDYLQKIEALELCCLINPTFREAHEELCHRRWGRSMELAAKSQFWFRQTASDAWGRLVERFGFETNAPAKPDVSAPPRQAIALDYIFSAHAAVKDLHLIKVGWNRDDGFPRDVPALDATAWFQSLAEEYSRRLIAVADRPEIEPKLASVVFGLRQYMPSPQRHREVLLALWPRLISNARKTGQGIGDEEANRIRQVFIGLGKTEEVESMLSELDRACNGYVSTTPVLTNAIIKLPRLAALSRSNGEDPFGLKRIEAPAPELSIPFTSIGIPTNGAKGVAALTVAGSKLWIKTIHSEASQSRASETALQLQPVIVEAHGLWHLNENDDEAKIWSGTFSTNERPEHLLGSSDGLWIAAGGGGLMLIENSSGDIRRYNSADGLQGSVSNLLAASSLGTFAVTDATNLFWLKHRSARWERIDRTQSPNGTFPLTGLAVGGEWLAATATESAFLNLKTGKWTALTNASDSKTRAINPHGKLLTSLDLLGGCWSLEPNRLGRFHPFQVALLWELNRGHAVPVNVSLPPGVVMMRGKDSPERKVASFRRMSNSHHELATGRTQGRTNSSTLFPSNRLPEINTPPIVDGEWIWIAGTDKRGAKLCAVHHPSQTMTPFLRLPSVPSAIAIGEKHVWIGFASRVGMASPLLSFAKSTLIEHAPNDRLPVELSKDERTALLDSLPSRDRSLLDFLEGRLEQAVTILDQQDPALIDPESLLLRALAFDADGLNDTNRSEFYFDALGAIEGDTNFLKSIRMTPDPLSIQRVVSRHDKNGDGSLSRGEVAFVRVRELQSQSRLTRTLGDLMFQYDRNTNSSLETTELTELLRHYELVESSASASTSFSPTTSTFQLLLRIDRNRDGKVSANEMLTQQFTPLERPESPPRLIKVPEYDLNGDGFLDPTELTALLGNHRPMFGPSSLRPSPSPMPQTTGTNRPPSLFRQFDLNQNGTLDESERKAMSEFLRNRSTSKQAPPSQTPP